MISRRMFLSGAFGCGIGALSLGSYSWAFEPRWIEVTNIDVKINALPKRFNGMTIVQLSDIHHSKYVPREFVRRCVRMANTLRPDIVVLTGDYIYGSDEFLLPVAEELAALEAREGVFAVLGNHDNKDIAIDVFSKMGIRVLMNGHIPLYRGRDYIFIAGVDDLWRGLVDLKKTLEGTDDKPKLLLAHNPDTIELIKNTGVDVDFVMSGHTHGGQVKVPLYGPPVTNSKFGVRYAAGLFHEGNTILYVNKGIGTSCLPVRFCARPEITLFTLRDKKLSRVWRPIVCC